MKVYVLFGLYDDGNEDFLGVFNSEFRAQEFIKSGVPFMSQEDRDIYFRIEEHMVAILSTEF